MTRLGGTPFYRFDRMEDEDRALFADTPEPVRPDGRWSALMRARQSAERAVCRMPVFERVPTWFIEQDEWTVPFA